MNKKKILSMGMAIALIFASIIPANVSAAPATGETVIQGSIEETEVIEVSGTLTTTWVLTKSGTFLSSPISWANNGPFPIVLGLSGYSKVGTLTDVLKDDTSVLGTLTGSETDEQLRAIFATLGKNGSKNIALYLSDNVTSQYKEDYVAGDIAFATLSDTIAANDGFYKLGTISGGNSISFDIEAFHGLAFNEALVHTTSLNYRAEIAD